MQTLILTHGALGTKADLDKLAVALTNENFKVYSFSFSGHGANNFENDFGIQQFSVELEKFILNNKLVKPSVIGHSMGGYVALYLALRLPDCIDKIVTLGTKFNWTKDVVEKETRILVPEVMLEKVPAFANMLELKHGAKWKELLAKIAQMTMDISENNYLNTETLKGIQNKVLIGLGDKDQMVTFEETIAAYKALPRASLFVLPNTKHPIEQLDTTIFTETIKGFLRS
jgi:pimeloyl-ACP methyl ester carboxylesterase